MAKCVNCRNSILTSEELADQLEAGVLEYREDLYSDEYLQLSYAENLYFCENCMEAAMEIQDMLKLTKSPIDRIRKARQCRKKAEESYKGISRKHLLNEIDYLCSSLKNGYLQQSRFFRHNDWLRAAELVQEAAKEAVGTGDMLSIRPVTGGSAVSLMSAFEQINCGCTTTLNLHILLDGGWCAVTAVTHGIDGEHPWREQEMASNLMEDFWKHLISGHEDIAFYDRLPVGELDD